MSAPLSPVDTVRLLQPSFKGVKRRLANFPTDVLRAAITAEQESATSRPMYIQMLEAEIERRQREDTPIAMDTNVVIVNSVGKPLDAAELPTADTAAIAAASEHRWIELEQLRPSPLNHRKHFDAKKMEELTANVRVQGVIVPILARPLSDGVFEIVAGERRFRAAKAAGLPKIPAIVRQLTDAQALEHQVIENNQREDVHPLEEAEGYEALIKSAGYSVDEIAAKVGKSRAYVYARLKLTALGKVGRVAFYDGKLDPSRALLLARIPIEELQEKALAEILKDEYGSGPMSYREAAEHIQYEYMLRLKSAPFKTADEGLLPAAGACTTCPKRTGAQPELFADLEVKDDLCTDPQCFAAKRDAHLEQMAAIAKAKGKDVVKPRAKGFVELDARVPGDYQGRTYRVMLGKQAPVPALMPTIDHQDKPQLVEVVRKADVQDLVKKKLEKQRQAGGSTSPRDWEKERKEAEAWGRTLFAHIVAAIPIAPGRRELELLVEDALQFSDANPPIVEELLITGKPGDGFVAESEKRIRKLLPKMDEHALLRLAIALRLSAEVNQWGEQQRLTEVANGYGINVAAVQKAHDAQRAAPVEPTPDPATQAKPDRKSKKKTEAAEA